MLGRERGKDLERPIKLSREEIYRPPLFPLMSTLSAIRMICVSEWKDDSQRWIRRTWTQQADMRGDKRMTCRGCTSSRNHHHHATCWLHGNQKPLRYHEHLKTVKTFCAMKQRWAHLRFTFPITSVGVDPLFHHEFNPYFKFKVP